MIDIQVSVVQNSSTENLVDVLRRKRNIVYGYFGELSRGLGL